MSVMDVLNPGQITHLVQIHCSFQEEKNVYINNAHLQKPVKNCSYNFPQESIRWGMRYGGMKFDIQKGLCNSLSANRPISFLNYCS
jgi:hypothetical protein